MSPEHLTKLPDEWIFERPIHISPETSQNVLQRILVLKNEPAREKTLSTQLSCDCGTGNTQHQFRQTDF